MGFLRPKEIVTIETILREEPEVMDYFGYEVAGKELLDEAERANQAEFRIGQANRDVWDRRLSTRIRAWSFSWRG